MILQTRYIIEFLQSNWNHIWSHFIISFGEISRKFSAVRWFKKPEDCIFPRSFILRSNLQSFNISPSFNLAISQSNLHLQNCSYLSTPFGSTHPFACIWDFLRAYLVHYMSIVLIFTETNAIKYLSHPAFMTRNIKAFTHVLTLPNLPVVSCYNQWQSLFIFVCHLIMQSYVLHRLSFN